MRNAGRIESDVEQTIAQAIVLEVKNGNGE